MVRVRLTTGPLLGNAFSLFGLSTPVREPMPLRRSDQSGAAARERADRELTGLITQVHHDSRGTYGAPQVHAELQMVLGLTVGRKRVARLMHHAGIEGVSHRRKRRHRPHTATHEDLVKRRFTADGPDRVWFTDITQHRATDGWVYCCAVLDAWSRRVVGWAIADHVRSELVGPSAARPRPGHRVRHLQGLQTPKYKEVPEHPIRMSRDFTKRARRDSNPKPSDP